MDTARYVIGCHLLQYTRVQNADDDVAITIHESLQAGAARRAVVGAAGHGQVAARGGGSQKVARVGGTAWYISLAMLLEAIQRRSLNLMKWVLDDGFRGRYRSSSQGCHTQACRIVDDAAVSMLAAVHNGGAVGRAGRRTRHAQGTHGWRGRVVQDEPS
jgi:hypothetical protein